MLLLFDHSFATSIIIITFYLYMNKRSHQTPTTTPILQVNYPSGFHVTCCGLVTMPSDVIQEVIRRNAVELNRRLPVNHLLIPLWSRKVIDIVEKTVIETQSNEIFQRNKFIDILMTKEDQHLDILLEELKKEGAHKGLFKILEESKKAVLAERFPQIQPSPPAISGDHHPQVPNPTPGDKMNNADIPIQTHAQLFTVAKRISEDDVALENIDTITRTFLSEPSQASDRHRIKEMGRRETPILARIVTVLECHKSASEENPTLGSISTLLTASGCINLAGEIKKLSLLEA